MSDQIQQHDFITIDYVAKTADDKLVFDVTQESKAKELGIYQKDTVYGAKTICVGLGQVIPGLDKSFVGKKVGESFTLSIEASDAFGKKEASLLQLVPIKKFKEAKIEPMVGLQVSADGKFGVIRSVSGGRVYVDFNHPLASKTVTYDVTITKRSVDIAQNIKILLGPQFGNTQISEKDTVVTITFEKGIPRLDIQLLNLIEKHIKEIIKSVSRIDFVFQSEEKVEQKAEQKAV